MKDKHGEPLILENHLYLVILSFLGIITSAFTQGTITMCAGIVSIIAGSCAIIYYAYSFYKFIRRILKNKKTK